MADPALDGVKLLSSLKDTLEPTEESLSPAVARLLQAKSDSYYGQEFSLNDIFAIWNSLSRFSVSSDRLISLELTLRYVLFHWTFFKLTKGKNSFTLSHNDSTRLLEMATFIVEKACFSSPLDFVGDLFIIVQKMYHVQLASKHQFHLEDFKFLFWKFLLVHIVASLKNEAFTSLEYLQNLQEFEFNLNEKYHVEFIGRFLKFLRYLKKFVPPSIPILVPFFDSTILSWIKNLCDLDEQSKDLVGEYISFLLDLNLRNKSIAKAMEYLDIFSVYGGPEKLASFHLKVDTLRQVPADFIVNGLGAIIDAVSSSSGSRKPLFKLLGDFFSFASELVEPKTLLLLINSVLDKLKLVLEFENSQEITEFLKYKCFLLCTIEDLDESIRFRDIKNFLSSILQVSPISPSLIDGLVPLISGRADFLYEKNEIHEAIRWNELLIFLFSFAPDAVKQATIYR